MAGNDKADGHFLKTSDRVKLPLTHTVRIYAIEFVAQLLNRSQRAAKDNMTAYELWWRNPYLALVERSTTLLVGTTGGVVKVNCVRRLLAIQSNDLELVKLIVGIPWDPTLGREARVLDYGALTATEPFVPEAALPPRILQTESQKPLRHDSTFNET